MSQSEKNEFSKTISKKMKAINKIKEEENLFIYGKEEIMPERIKKAKTLIKNFPDQSIFYSENLKKLDQI